MADNKFSCEMTIIWRKYPEVKPERDDFYTIYDPSVELDDLIAGEPVDSGVGQAYYSVEHDEFLMPEVIEGHQVMTIFEGVTAFAEFPGIPKFNL